MEIFRANTEPIDWSCSNKPHKTLVALDEFVLSLLRASVTVEELYRDLSSSVAARYHLAKNKTGKQTKKQSESVSSVSLSISDRLRPVLESKLFPEIFIGENAVTEYFPMCEIEWNVIECHPMMGQTELWLHSINGDPIQMILPSTVAEVVVYAILLGRSDFNYPTDQKLVDSALKGMRTWMNTLKDMLEQAIADSSAGSGYEDMVRATVLAQLGIHQAVFEKTLPLRIER